MLIIVACAGMGYRKNQELKQHIKALVSLKQIFLMLKSELQYTKGTFEEIFERVGDKSEGWTRKWLQSIQRTLREKEGKTFFEIWQYCIEKELQESNLNKEDLDELRRIGKNLGQIENIELFIEQLEYKIKGTREHYETKGKLYRSLGIMGGVFLVILFL